MTTTMTTARRATPTAAAEVRDAVKTYGDGERAVHALDRVTLTFPTGTFTAVMGPSGSGKSTLLHALGGLDTLDNGEVRVAGIALGAMTDRQRTVLRREQIGFVFQSFNLVPALSTRENITLPLALAGNHLDAGWFESIVATLGLRDRLEHLPSELSGGQQQRVAIARALVMRPALVLADEPTGNLDSAAGDQVLGFLRDAVDRLARTVVMVTHDPGAASYADRVVLLADGRVADVLDRPTVDTVLTRMRRLGAPAAG